MGSSSSQTKSTMIKSMINLKEITLISTLSIEIASKEKMEIKLIDLIPKISSTAKDQLPFLVPTLLNSLVTKVTTNT